MDRGEAGPGAVGQGLLPPPLPVAKLARFHEQGHPSFFSRALAAARAALVRAKIFSRPCAATTAKIWTVTARSGIAAVVLGGRIFVFGGEATTGTFDEVESYDPKNGRWRAHAKMPSARHGLGTAAVTGRIFVFSGGRTPGGSVSSANEIFTP